MADRAAATPNEMLAHSPAVAMQRAGEAGAALLLARSASQVEQIDAAERDRRTLILPAFTAYAEASRRPVVPVAAGVAGLALWLRSRPAATPIVLDDLWSAAGHGVAGFCLGAILDRLLEGSALDLSARAIGPLPATVERSLLARCPDASPARVVAWREAWRELADAHNAGLPRGGGGALQSALAFGVPLMRH